MKIHRKDYRKGFVKLEIQNLDDLWYISTIIDEGDRVSAKTERKIKLGGDDQRNTKIVKKKVWLTLIVEKIQFSKTTNDLRISGKIAEGKDEIAAGDYHTIACNEKDVLELDKGKKGFLKYQQEKIEEAVKNKSSQILVCALDRGEATFALLKKYGYELLSTVTGSVEKKDYDDKTKSTFFQDTAEQLSEYVKRHSITTVIIGSVAFWKDNLQKELKKQSVNAKMIYTTCSAAGENGITEIMSNDDIKAALQNERFSVEMALVNDVLQRISKQGHVAYGLKEVQHAADLGAIETLLVSDEYIRTMREQEKYQQLDSIMRTTDQANGNITIVSSEHEGGEQLNGLGGIAALLRFSIQ
jgi:protein pelota